MDKYLKGAMETGALTTSDRIAMEIAASIDRVADAIALLARATAGEFEDDGGELPEAGSLSEVRP